MLTLNLLGALLIIGGVVHIAWTAIRRGGMSDPGRSPNDTVGRTLEPDRRGLGFLSWKANWPGLLMVAAGGLMLLLPALVATPAP
jgi:hypothetical protein